MEAQEGARSLLRKFGGEEVRVRGPKRYLARFL